MIISNHVFSDGNKRTGLTAALTFLDMNGYELQRNLTPGTGNYDDDLEAFTIKVASGLSDLDDCRNWFSENLKAQ